MAYLTTSSATTASFADRTRAVFHGMATQIKRRRMYRETYDGLSALTNRELSDLGLNRSELRHVAWESACNAVN